MIGLSFHQVRTAVALFPKRPPTCLHKEKSNILGLLEPDLRTILSLTKFQTYRARQIYNFLYKKRGTRWTVAEMLPKDLREWLDERYYIDTGKLVEKHDSEDGRTRRYIIETQAGRRMESVVIGNVTTERKTLCISSQAGCSLACTFCSTGAQPFQGQLSSGDILAQYLHHPASRPDHERPITNIVFMGQGEPLYNWRNVAAAVDILTDEHGIGMGKGRVTISTSGIAPLIPKVAEELGVNLAISLHAPTDALRTSIMAINKSYPIPVLMEACREFVAKAPAQTRRLTFEYVMLEGVNDGDTCADDLTALLSANLAKEDVHVNLLPFNAWPGAPYTCSPLDRIAAFRERLEVAGVPCTVRIPKGRDIMAACGQLSKHSTALNTQ